MRAGVLKLFLIMPVVALMVAWHLVTSPDWMLTVFVGVLLYFPIHYLGQAIGMHKLFGHRAFTPVRWYPPVAAFVASISFFGDPLASAMTHRLHHKNPDTPQDPHSPLYGRFHAYMGWVTKWKPTSRDALVVTDLIRDYPWMLPYRKVEWVIPIVFHSAMFLFAGWLFYPVALACVISIQNGLLLNAFSHSPHIEGSNKAIDSPLLATLFNPIFLHKQHHHNGSLMDYSSGGVRDGGAWVIRNFLELRK